MLYYSCTLWLNRVLLHLYYGGSAVSYYICALVAEPSYYNCTLVAEPCPTTSVRWWLSRVLLQLCAGG